MGTHAVSLYAGAFLTNAGMGSMDPITPSDTMRAFEAGGLKDAGCGLMMISGDVEDLKCDRLTTVVVAEARTFLVVLGESRTTLCITEGSPPVRAPVCE